MLDVILFSIISTKSSISAAAAVSTYQLHCGGAITDGDSAQTRQDLSNATDAYSRTLLVQRNNFKCEDCYHSAEMPYSAVVADGQTIGIFRDSSFPFERDAANVTARPIYIDNACTVLMPKVRKCVRQRLKAGMGDIAALNKAEQAAMAKFVATAGVAPPLGKHSDASHRVRTGQWAASCIFNSILTMSSQPEDASHDVSSSSSCAGAKEVPPPSARGVQLLLSRGRCEEASPKSPGHSVVGSPLLRCSVRDDEISDESSAAATGEASSSFAKFKYCNIIPAAIGGRNLAPVFKRERWSTVFHFFRTFIAEPVLGMFSGCAVEEIQRLAGALIVGKTYAEWGKLAMRAISSCGLAHAGPDGGRAGRRAGAVSHRRGAVYVPTSCRPLHGGPLEVQDEH